MELRRLKKVDVNFSSTTGYMWRGKVFLRERSQCPDICNERLVIIYNFFHRCVVTVTSSTAWVCFVGISLHSTFGYFDLGDICEFKRQDNVRLPVSGFYAQFRQG